MILVKSFYAHNELRNYSYLIYDNHTGDSWVIDPFDAGPIMNYIRKNGLVLKGILNTHQHWDHVQGNAPLMEAFGAPVRKLKHSESLNLGSGHGLETIDTPGHTLDHQVFLWKQGDQPLALFSGDTLFNSGVGNCKNGGDVNLLYETTEKLLQLPQELLLYPGHDYRKRNLEFGLAVEPENKVIKEKLRELDALPTHELPPTSLKDEKLLNPFFRLDREEIRQTLKKQSLPLSEAGKNRRELFINLRKLRDQW